MRRVRLYHSEILTDDQDVLLNPEASHHLLKVLRKKPGDIFWVFDGAGAEFEAEIVGAEKKQALIKIIKKHQPVVESPVSIHLGQAISRGDRMDYAIQKAVELGVAEITPLFTDFCQVKLSKEKFDKKISHWQSIAISAAEQSGRCVVPKIHAPEKFNDWIVNNIAEVKYICCPRISCEALSQHGKKPQTISVAIGPEGGFSDIEVGFALPKDFQSLTLGPRVLRTETASVVALTLLQSRFGDV